mmetsp:Transcript_3592/g.7264  ORF Transcript_3592/g.7264 Transcript_3592/m.7264 type:complete len:208 (+) Transcript_3592:365-988(+)
MENLGEVVVGNEKVTRFHTHPGHRHALFHQLLVVCAHNGVDSLIVQVENRLGDEVICRLARAGTDRHGASSVFDKRIAILVVEYYESLAVHAVRRRPLVHPPSHTCLAPLEAELPSHVRPVEDDDTRLVRRLDALHNRTLGKRFHLLEAPTLLAILLHATAHRKHFANTITPPHTLATPPRVHLSGERRRRSRRGGCNAEAGCGGGW